MLQENNKYTIIVNDYNISLMNWWLEQPQTSKSEDYLNHKINKLNLRTLTPAGIASYTKLMTRFQWKLNPALWALCTLVALNQLAGEATCLSVGLLCYIVWGFVSLCVTFWIYLKQKPWLLWRRWCVGFGRYQR